MLQPPPPVGSALNPAGALPAATPAPSSAGSALTTYDHAAYSSSLASSAAYPGALPLPPAADLRSGAGLGLGYSSTDRSYMMPAFNKGYYGNYGENLSSLTSPPGFVPRQG